MTRETLADEIEPVELDGTTPDEVMRCIREAVDLAYKTTPRYENARVNLSAT